MPDPDLEISGGPGGGGGGGGGGQSPKIFTEARRASVWSKNKWGPGSPRSPPPPLDTPLKMDKQVKLRSKRM